MTPSVLHVSSNRGWGGGENQVRLLMRELRDANVRQLCICPSDSPLAQRLRYLGLPVRPVTWKRGMDPRALFGIARALGGYDVVHCHDAHALQLALLPAKIRGVRIVAARRVRFPSRALKWNRADIVIAVSQTVRESLIQAGVHERRIVVIHSGTDRAETRAVKPLTPSLREKYAIPASALVAGSAAAFHPVKDLALIPAAAALLPDVHWLIAGDGAERERVEAAIAAHGVAERVHLTGWLTDARALLQELDVYVSTSTGDGLGNSITESLALGVPVLAADAGGPAEIMRPIENKTGAVLFEPRNAAALARCIEKLRDAGLRDRVVTAQNDRFADFSIDRTAAATLAVYRQVMQQ